MTTRHLARALAALPVCLLIAAGCARSRAAPPPAAAADGAAADSAQDYTAVVTPREARFELPLPDRARWQWNRPETGDNYMEYQWSAEVVSSGGRAYDFGFFLFKFAGSRPGRGNLAALLRAGQMSVSAGVGDGRRLIPEEVVDVRPRRGRLVITLLPGETLRMLLAERPARATVRSQVPGEAAVSREVPITYAER